MYVGINAASGHYFAFTCDYFSRRANNGIYPGLNIGIARFTYREYSPILKANVSFDYPPVVQDEGIGDDGINRPFPPGYLGLTHAITDNLTPTELDLLAIETAICFHLYEKLRISQSDLVSSCWPEHVGVGPAVHFPRHRQPSRGPFERPLNPVMTR